MTNEQQNNTTPYAWAALCGAVVLAIYYATLAPTTAFWDTSEYIAAAKVLGIPHPPGNPLFTLLAHVFALLPLAAEYAARVNIFAAVTSAAGAGFWFLVAERWTRVILPARGPRLASAFAGVLAGATAWTVWNQSTVNEKVYTVSLLSIAVITWCAVKWADDPDTERRDRWLIGAAYLIALTSTNHQMGILAAPVVAVYVLMTDWKMLLKPWFLTMSWLLLLGLSGQLGAFGNGLVGGGELSGTTTLMIAIAAGLTIWAVAKNPRQVTVWIGITAVIVGFSINYIYLPIRAGQLPAINEGEPAGFFSNALMDVLNREQYAKPGLSQRIPGLIDQYGNYWQYWSWQWARDIGGLSGIATGLFTVLGLGGLWALIKSDRRAGLAAAALLFTLTILLVFYLNFKFGYSYRAGDPLINLDMREVRERDYFFIGSFAFAGVLIAAGLAASVRAVGDWLGDRVPDHKRYLAATPLLAVALIPLIGNRVTASRAHETLARDFAIDILESVEPYGILITAGDNDTFPLWFAQEVLGVRRDVTLANLSLMNTDWHLRQLRRRDLPDFDPATAAELWRPGTDVAGAPLGGFPDSGWVRPTTPVLNLTIDQLDSLPQIMATPDGARQLDSIVIQFGEEYLTRSDIATFMLIRDNLGKRPIYFSWSDGGYPDTMLGLTPYLISQGMVRKLSPTPVVPDSNGVIFDPTRGFVDLVRTQTLLDEVYHHEAATWPRPRGWVDAPSASIMSLYYIVYGAHADLLSMRGDSALAAKADNIAQAVARNLR